MTNNDTSQPPSLLISSEMTLSSTPNESLNPPIDAPSLNEIGQTQQGETNDNIEEDETTQDNPSRLKSVVWDHFKKIKVNGKEKAKCNYCNKELCGSARDGTTHLHGHLKICVKRKIMLRSEKGQTYLTSKTVQRKQELGTGIYDAEKARKELAHAIILHEYPLSIVDHVGFRRYSASLQPLFQVPCRNTIKKEIFKVYDYERSTTLKLLESNEGRVAITSDMWTASNQKKGYMAVTAHYIDGNWTLHSHILRFIYVPAPHTSERLCNALVECLMDWNIDTKLSTITLDNCSTNDAMVEKIKDKLQLDKLLRDGAFLHMRCCAHILNLIVKEGLEVVKDGVERIRDSVAYWTATPKRKEKFEETAKQLRITCTKSLVLDCPTRWNSTYKMLDVAILYEDVFSRLRQRESQYTCLPSSSQWKFAKEICERLKLFNEITEVFSGTKYPTANEYFPKICRIKIALYKWIESSNELITKMVKNMLDKFDKYWSVVHEIMGVAAVLDPRYKIEMVEYYYVKLYMHDANDKVKYIQQLCYDLFYEYQLKMNNSTCTDSQTLDVHVGNVGNDDLKDYDMYVRKKKRARTSSVRTELDVYLDEEILPRSPDFDILLWWKLNGIKYPTLQAIARDVLAIPVSTVASESAFSTSGNILSPHRSRLHWTTLEALMCARSWLWSAEYNGDMKSKVGNENAILLDEMESEDEGELTISDVTSISHYDDKDDY